MGRCLKGCGHAGSGCAREKDDVTGRRSCNLMWCMSWAGAVAAECAWHGQAQLKQSAVAAECAWHGQLQLQQSVHGMGRRSCSRVCMAWAGAVEAECAWHGQAQLQQSVHGMGRRSCSRVCTAWAGAVAAECAWHGQGRSCSGVFMGRKSSTRAILRGSRGTPAHAKGQGHACTREGPGARLHMRGARGTPAHARGQSQAYTREGPGTGLHMQMLQPM
eukprot:365329-Chlamydomonas_euryale.AAC.6